MSEIEHEVADQPRCWRRAAELAASSCDVLPPPGARVAAIGCGTSRYIAEAFAAYREGAGMGETDAFAASEVPDRRYDWVIFVSRSGTTTEVVRSAERAAGRSRTVSITAVPDSLVAQSTDLSITLGFADERSVVQTRFATSCLALLRAHLGHDVPALAREADEVLSLPLPLDPLAFNQFVFVGQGPGAALANEAALKVRESSGSWTEAYPAMELRHGPLSTFGPHTVLWMLNPGPPGLVADVQLTGASCVVPHWDPMVELVTVQRAAIARATGVGLDPDHPRFLERSVILNQ